MCRVPHLQNKKFNFIKHLIIWSDNNLIDYKQIIKQLKVLTSIWTNVTFLFLSGPRAFAHTVPSWINQKRTQSLVSSGLSKSIPSHRHSYKKKKKSLAYINACLRAACLIRVDFQAAQETYCMFLLEKWGHYVKHKKINSQIRWNCSSPTHWNINHILTFCKANRFLAQNHIKILFILWISIFWCMY